MKTEEIDMVKVNQKADEITTKALESNDSYKLALADVAQQLAMMIVTQEQQQPKRKEW